MEKPVDLIMYYPWGSNRNMHAGTLTNLMSLQYWFCYVLFSV